MLRKSFTKNYPEEYEKLKNEFLNYIPKRARNKNKIFDCILSLLFKGINNDRGFIKEGKGEIWIYLKPNKYPIQNFTYTQTMHAKNALLETGMFYLLKGKRVYRPLDEKAKEWVCIHSSISKLRAQPLKEWKFSNPLKIFSDLMLPFVKDKPPAIHRTKTKNEITEWESTETAIKKIEKINNFLEEKGLGALKYQRIYGKNESENGRLYSKFTLMSKENRKYICEKYDWVEIDLKSSFINMIKFKETGKLFDSDPYVNLMNLFPFQITRKEAKQIVNSVLCVKSKSLAVKSIRNFLWEKRENYSPELILEGIENSFPDIKHTFYKENHIWATNIESEALVNTLNIMMKYNILPLSVHDSIIIPRDYLNYFKDIFLYQILSILNNNNFIIINNTFPFHFPFYSNRLAKDLKPFKNNKIFDP